MAVIKNHLDHPFQLETMFLVHPLTPSSWQRSEAPPPDTGTFRQIDPCFLNDQQVVKVGIKKEIEQVNPLELKKYIKENNIEYTISEGNGKRGQRGKQREGIRCPSVFFRFPRFHCAIV